MAKNKHIEKLIRLAKAKRYKNIKNISWDPKYKIFIYHSYSSDAIPVAYWDSVSFIRGSQIIYVDYSHPRNESLDKVFKLAMDRAKALCGGEPRDFFEKSKPNYRYLGKNKNRKRIVSWTMTPTMITDYYDILEQEREKIKLDNDIAIRPRMTVTQKGFGKYVYLCCPFEAYNPETLKELTEQVRSWMDGKESFDKMYAGYTYTKADYIKESVNLLS